MQPLDEKPSFNQSGIGFILPRDLVAALENSKAKGAEVPETLKRKASDQEDTTEANEEGAKRTMFLDDSKVLPRPAPTLRMIKRSGKNASRKGGQNRVHVLPDAHKYKTWTKKALLTELEGIVEKGCILEYAKSWPREKLMVPFPLDDGEELSWKYETAEVGEDMETAMAEGENLDDGKDGEDDDEKWRNTTAGNKKTPKENIM